MSVKFRVQMTAEYMYDFMLYHNYTHASGIISAILGVVSLGTAIQYIVAGNVQYFCVWLMCAILLLFINPYTMKTRAKSQVQNTEMFQKPLEYEITEAGIAVRQDEAEATTTWDEVTKVIKTRKSVIVYLGRVRALIFPKACMGEQYEEVVNAIRTHLPAKKVKL